MLDSIPVSSVLAVKIVGVTTTLHALFITEKPALKSLPLRTSAVLLLPECLSSGRLYCTADCVEGKEKTREIRWGKTWISQKTFSLPHRKN